MRNRQRVSRSDSVAPATPAHSWSEALTDAVGWQTLVGFIVLACITMGARFVADLEQGQLADDWLLLAAIRSNVPLFAMGVVALVRFRTRPRVASPAVGRSGPRRCSEDLHRCHAGGHRLALRDR